MAAGSLALDTTVVVLRLRQAAPAVEQKFLATGELYLPVTALGELRYGVEHSGNTQRALEKLEIFLHQVTVIYPDDETAKIYGVLKQHLAKSGTPIPENDLWIAATAKRHALRLYHQDTHFSKLDGLIDHEHV